MTASGRHCEVAGLSVEDDFLDAQIGIIAEGVVLTDLNPQTSQHSKKKTKLGVYLRERRPIVRNDHFVAVMASILCFGARRGHRFGHHLSFVLVPNKLLRSIDDEEQSHREASSCPDVDGSILMPL